MFLVLSVLACPPSLAAAQDEPLVIIGKLESVIEGQLGETRRVKPTATLDTASQGSSAFSPDDFALLNIFPESKPLDHIRVRVSVHSVVSGTYEAETIDLDIYNEFGWFHSFDGDAVQIVVLADADGYYSKSGLLDQLQSTKGGGWATCAGWDYFFEDYGIEPVEPERIDFGPSAVIDLTNDYEGAGSPEEYEKIQQELLEWYPTPHFSHGSNIAYCETGYRPETLMDIILKTTYKYQQERGELKRGDWGYDDLYDDNDSEDEEISK